MIEQLRKLASRHPELADPLKPVLAAMQMPELRVLVEKSRVIASGQTRGGGPRSQDQAALVDQSLSSLRQRFGRLRFSDRLLTSARREFTTALLALQSAYTDFEDDRLSSSGLSRELDAQLRRLEHAHRRLVQIAPDYDYLVS